MTRGATTRPPRSHRELAAALGTEPVGRLLWRSCAQTIMSVSVYGLYAVTNAWFVAWGVGPVALAAVTTVAPVLLALGAVAATVGAGAASLVSRSLGAGDPAQAARAAGTAFVVFWTTAVVGGVAGVVLIDPLLTLLGATGELRGYARDYAVVILGGAITGTGFSSLVRAEGRLRFSTMMWVWALATQIVLDPVLIFGFGLGVRGAAWGTVAGQAVSTVMSLWFFFGPRQHRRPYRIGLTDLRPHGPTLRRLVAVGSPSFLAGVGATLLAALTNTLLVAAGGAVALSAGALCVRIGTLVAMPQLGIAQGLQPVAGFNAGSGAVDRVRRATTLTVRATVGYGVVAGLVLLVAADPLAGLFTSDPAVCGQAATALRIVALGCPFAGLVPLLSARFQALGQPLPSYLLSIGTVLVVKIPLLVAGGSVGVTALWISVPVAELVSAGAALLVLRRWPWPAEGDTTGTRSARRRPVTRARASGESASGPIVHGAGRPSRPGG
ncbi:MATE family efflux transporter [Micromonospora rosaria]|uniref:MATE family efflux transporter n=1 Tax=Micromonospora rosaria TaxID=47874 RepID=UPI00082E7504|nr:MATE family efflux transporter [Micromonospora rosaria]